MTQDTRYKFIAILVLGLLCAYIVAPIPNKPKIPVLSEAKLNLGIDLNGGAELRYRVLYSPEQTNRKQLTQDATDVIRRRVEAKRTLVEPKINAQGDDEIVIQLPGADQTVLEDFKKLVEQAGKLELYATASKEIQERYNEQYDKSPTNPPQPPDGYVLKDNAKEGRSSTGDYGPWGRAKVLLKEKPIIDGGHITKADPEPKVSISGASWGVSFELNADGAKLFDEAAYSLFHLKPPGMIAILLDDAIQSMPVVRAESFRGRGEITGNFSENDARNLAIILRSGKLPAPIGKFGPNGERIPREPEAEFFVGPTLGEDAIRRGLFASGVTLGLVALFMLFYYRKAGFISIVTLVLNMIFLLALMSFFQATLTLPGIAGIVLTVGMAVDANILIYERIREEQARGKTATQAFESGHERAFSSIVDANVTTLVAAIVLYYAGSGPVKGFAVTLSIGILTTLFSVLVCGKTFLKMLLLGGLNEFKMMRLMSDPKLDYLKIARPLVIASAILVTAGTVFFVSRGSANLGIDFRGGSMISFAMSKEMNIKEVRDRIQQKKNPDGTNKYADAEVQTVADPTGGKSRFGIGSSTATSFQLRTSFASLDEIKADLQEIFRNELSHEPFGEMKPEEANKNERLLPTGVGPGWWLYLKSEKPIDEIKKAVSKALAPVVLKNDAGEPAFLLTPDPDAPAGMRKLKLELPKENSNESQRREIRTRLKNELAADLSRNPFLAQGSIGPSVAKELVNSSFWAMIASWVLMIIYVAFRFASWKYGVAAVIALVHDALVAIAFTSLAGALIPKSWGLSFEMNLTTMAAILTIIGFSINDTIVIFDRIRENLTLMKKATFSEIINTSVNQTMSRTILTSFTVWISAMVLYFATMNTGGGIAEFAFPLLIGVIAGTYSTIYIASPIVLWWHKGQRPA